MCFLRYHSLRRIGSTFDRLSEFLRNSKVNDLRPSSLAYHPLNWPNVFSCNLKRYLGRTCSSDETGHFSYASYEGIFQLPLRRRRDEFS